jgi:hypothetical protein
MDELLTHSVAAGSLTAGAADDHVLGAVCAEGVVEGSTTKTDFGTVSQLKRWQENVHKDSDNFCQVAWRP